MNVEKEKIIAKSVRLPEKLADWISIVAKRERRPFTQTVVMMLEKLMESEEKSLLTNLSDS